MKLTHLKHLAFIFLTVLPCFAFPSDSLPTIPGVPSIPGWVPLAADTKGKNFFYGKVDSFKINSNGLSLIIQVISSGSSAEYVRAFISRNTCELGYGEMTISSLSGKSIGNIDYVKGGLSLGSNMGDILCYTLENIGK
ncbi:TPA: hypothetical protein MH599_29205 [Klebsiella pneumoniae]|jgi:hypothetical protein|nr:hypothetical protein [Klebsiella pneumoniae]